MSAGPSHGQGSTGSERDDPGPDDRSDVEPGGTGDDPAPGSGPDAPPGGDTSAPPRGDSSAPPGGDSSAPGGDGGRAQPPARGMLVERAAEMGVAPAPPPRRTGVFVDVEELRGHVGGLLRSMLGGYEVDALGNFTFTAEGARIFVTVGPGPMGPHVGVFSILTVDLPLTDRLAGFLLTTNHRLAFGAFSYEPEQRAVWLRHSLLGATLDGPELRGVVVAIASTAAKVTALLRERFGSDAFAEESEERQRAVRPPEPVTDDEVVNAGGYL